jgi:hypothetical protein
MCNYIIQQQPSQAGAGQCSPVFKACFVCLRSIIGLLKSSNKIKTLIAARQMYEGSTPRSWSSMAAQGWLPMPQHPAVRAAAPHLLTPCFNRNNSYGGLCLPFPSSLQLP